LAAAGAEARRAAAALGATSEPALGRMTSFAVHERGELSRDTLAGPAL
jgi:hypothetical protein